MSNRNELQSIEDIKRYLQGGNGKFTLHNTNNGKHKTYCMKQPEKVKDKGLSFVSILYGPENVNDYAFCGTIKLNRLSYKISAKSRYGRNSVNQKTISWLLLRIHQNKPLPSNMKFYHEGSCCRCGRTLTTPESIKGGIGPTCARL